MKKVLVAVLLCAVVLVSSCTPSVSETPTPTSPPTSTPAPTADEHIDKGNQFARARQYEEAEEAFLRAIEIDSGSADAHAGLAFTYYNWNQKLDESLRLAEKAVLLDPDDSRALAVLAMIQEFHLIQESLENAQKAHELDPEDVFAARVLAHLYLTHSEHLEAYKIIEKIYEDHPDDPDTYELLGDYFFSIADFGVSEAAYRKALELDPEDVSGRESLLYFYYWREDYEKAIKQAEEILALDPENFDAIFLLSQIYMERHELNLAEEWVDKMAEIYPEEYYTIDLQADLQFYQYEYEAAIDLYRDALEIFPKDAHAQFMIGLSYNMMDDCERALVHYQDLVELYPNPLNFQMGEVSANLCSGKLDKAASQLKNILETDPYHATGTLVTGAIYLYQSRWEDAHETLIEGMKISPQLAGVHASLGEMLMYQGYNDDAEEELLRAIEINPYQIEAYTLLTGLMLNQGRVREASTMMHAAVKINPDDPTVLFYQGLVNYFEGDYFNASKNMNKVLEMEPETHLCHLYIGLAKRSMADYTGAYQSIENYMALAGDAIPDNEIFLLNGLLDALDNGYTLTENWTIESIQELLNYFDLPQTNLRFEDIPGKGRTLVADMNFSQSELETETFLFETSLVLTINSLYVPRTYPETEGGSRMIVHINGREMFIMDAPLQVLSDFSDTLLQPDQLLMGIEFDLTSEMARTRNFPNIYRDTAEVREIPALEIPPQTTITTEEISAEAAESMDEQLLAALELEEALLQILDLVPDEYDHTEVWVETYGEGIAGFYVPEDNQVFLVEQDELTAADQITLSHEGVHAMQFQEFDISGYENPDLNDDERLAYLSLIEGDATLASFTYLEEYIPVFDQIHMFWIAAGLSEEDIQETPAFIQEFRLFPYTYGYNFVNTLYQRGGWEEVNKAYQNPPTSSEQIMHPWRYLEQGEDDLPVKVDMSEDLASLGDEWEIVDQNVMGEFGIYMMMADYFGKYAAEEAAYGWRGDQYVLLKNKDSGSMAFLLQVKWDDGDGEQIFTEYFKAAMLHRPEFYQLVEQFLPRPEKELTWTDGDSYIINRQGQGPAITFLLIGQDLEELQTILAEVDK